VDKITRRELKHDKFQEEVVHSIDFLAQHREQVKKYGIIAGVVLIAAIAVWGYMRHQSGVRMEALRAAMEIQEGHVGENPPPGARTFKTQTEKEDAAIKAFGEIASKYGGSREGEIARYYMGTLLADQGKVAEAEKAFQEVAREGGAEYAALAKLSLATIYAGQGKYNEAETLLKQLVDRPTILVSREQAQIALAKVYMKSKPLEARKLVEELQKIDRPVVQRAAVNVLGDLSGAPK